MRWQTSPTRFTEVTAVLPALIGDVEHSVRAHRTGPDKPARREVLRAAADLFFLLRSYLRRTGRTDLALLAADRAARAAEDADDPLRIPAAQWNLGTHSWGPAMRNRRRRSRSVPSTGWLHTQWWTGSFSP
ncbi:hypothetical protein AB0901_04225 [Streptomyces roseifaciens]